MLKFDGDYLEFRAIHDFLDDRFLLQVSTSEDFGDRTGLQPQNITLEFAEWLACVSFTPFDLNVMGGQPNLEFGASPPGRRAKGGGVDSGAAR